MHVIQSIMGWHHQSAGQFVTWASDTMSVIFNWTQQVAQFVAQMVSSIQSLAQRAATMVQNIGSSIGTWISHTVQAVGQSLSGSTSTATPTGPSGSAANVSSWIQQAMQDTGVAGGAWRTMLTRLVTAESGGNPNAVSATGVNYGGGHGIEHAMGLGQMMPSTFQEYMKAGMTNILNPVDNLVSSIRYISAQFGNPQTLMQKTGLGTSSYKGYATGGLLTEAIAGVGLTSGQHYMMGEAGPEMVVPLSQMGRGAHGGQTFNIQVSVNAASSDPRQMAQQVASELVQQLKRRANLSWGI